VPPVVALVTGNASRPRQPGPGDGDLSVCLRPLRGEYPEIHRGRLDEDARCRLPVEAVAAASRPHHERPALFVVGSVVLGPRRRVGQEVKGPLNVLEPRGGVRIVVDVRMVLADELVPEPNAVLTSNSE
jgi:hypothetical protein